MDIIAGMELPRTMLGHAALDVDSGLTPTILLIDDRILERECLIFRLNVAGFRVVAAASAEGWRDSAEAGRLSLILYVCDGLAEKRRRTVAGLLQAPHGHPVVVLSQSDAVADVIETIECGARGYITTRANVEHVIAAIRFVLAGGVFVPASSVLAARKAETEPAVDPSWHGNFTAKQVAVIEGIRRGKPNKVIAYELNMCESTVKVHVRNVMKKLKARNRTELAFKATEMTL
ncbi:LuxR C-terminal-related transcriptional regulator [Methylobacterium sp. J-068]|uniref:LuxR C-terminal-related transcriptional regulator n=1 Tax=Methylobacterium sp. J-068 TaxID=2836649 RepID=UPI001FB89B4A|nr:response regulator transcription factor [Methylobacterium sp. J-068]MCJ2034861.1 response regulator transcription factor [Methylobacterium sp. J-068]